MLLGAVLKQAGYSVEVAEDGFEALRKLQQVKPDLVITDFRMPNMNGFELLAVLRNHHPEIPTVGISGEFVSIEIEGGTLADAFFQKGSYALPDFLAKIADLLSHPAVRKQHERAPIWAPTKDARPMLTCTQCLQSFPIDICEGAVPAKRIACIFCGEVLEIQLFAIGVGSSGPQ